MTAHTAVAALDLTRHRTAGGLTVTASALATVPMVQAHLAIPLDMSTERDSAAFDVLAACWPESAACAVFEQHGGIVAVNRRRQWLMLSLICGSDRVALIGDTLRGLTLRDYSDAEVTVGKAKSLQQATLAAAQPGVDSARRMWEAMYGWLPPVAASSPDPEAVGPIGVEHVREAHRRGIKPAGAHLVVVGDIDAGRIVDGVERALAGWTSPAETTDPAPAPEPLAARRVMRHHRPNWQQSHIRLAAPSLPHTDLDGYAAALVASLVLGGNFSSRINTVLREEHGLAYRTSGTLTDVLGQDLLVLEADVNPRSTASAMRRLLGILGDFADSGPTGQELDTAIGYTRGSYALSLSSQGGRASCLMSYLITGIDLSGIVEIPERIAATTASAVQRAASLFAPAHLRGAVCGDTRELPASWL